MYYNEFIGRVSESLKKFANNQETDLILLKSHLIEIVRDIESDPNYKGEIEFERVGPDYGD